MLSMNKTLMSNLESYNYGLLIIDVQGKIIKPIRNNDVIIKNINKLIQAFEILQGSIFVSEQNPIKLGKTVSNIITANNLQLFQKMDFSIGRKKELLDVLSRKKINNLIICGFETHICIQQSVCDFISQDFKTFIIEDAMGSRSSNDHKIALKRMISEGATLASTESIIFELCRTSSRKEFKQISNVIKNKNT